MKLTPEGRHRYDPTLRQKVADADNLYESLVRNAGLYGQAFFGHATSAKEQSTLDWCWIHAQKKAGLR